MAKELLWSEDCDRVWGWARDFKNAEDFKNEVKNNYENGECEVTEIEKKLCITTDKGLQAETITPIEDADIEMEWFYIADVEEIEEAFGEE